MNRSGYTDDLGEQWDFIRWRGAVKAAIKGKRGQAFLLEMHRAMLVLPEPMLISDKLQDEYDDSKVCAIGAVGRSRGMDMTKLEAEDEWDDIEIAREIAAAFDIPYALAAEIMWLNDDVCGGVDAEFRFLRVKNWIEDHLLPVADDVNQG